MLIKSDSLQCKVTLSHEEVTSLGRWLKARLVGGAMLAADQAIVEDFAANMLKHDCMIEERESRIGEVEKAVCKDHRITAAIQRLNLDEFAQVKDMFEVQHISAADFVSEASLVNVTEVAERLKAVGHNIVVDEQHGIYQVCRD